MSRRPGDEVERCTGTQRSWVRIPYKPEFFPGHIFAAGLVGYITAMKFYEILSLFRSQFSVSYIHSFLSLLRFER